MDGVRRQASLLAHVGGELVNQVGTAHAAPARPRSRPQEAQPISSDLHEPLAAVACSGDAAVSSLMPTQRAAADPISSGVIALVPSMSMRSATSSSSLGRCRADSVQHLHATQ